eukprot:9225084-Alexandrium_andersonii.AAC.1
MPSSEQLAADTRAIPGAAAVDEVCARPGPPAHRTERDIPTDLRSEAPPVASRCRPTDPNGSGRREGVTCIRQRACGASQTKSARSQKQRWVATTRLDVEARPCPGVALMAPSCLQSLPSAPCPGASECIPLAPAASERSPRCPTNPCLLYTSDAADDM